MPLLLYKQDYLHDQLKKLNCNLSEMANKVSKSKSRLLIIFFVLMT